MWLFLTIIVIASVYYFRFQILKWCLCRLVWLYTVYYNKKDGITKVSIKKYNNCYVHEYKLVHQNFHHTVKVIHDTDSHELSIHDTISKLGHKTCIVHCNLSGESNEYIMDLTDLIREFFVHFNSNIKFAYFLDYLEEHTKRKLDDDCKIVFYKNDETFSEVSMNLQSLREKRFYELVMN